MTAHSRIARAVLVAASVATLLSASRADAHHVGAYAPRDNEISANFKQIKFAIQARKLDVALRLFDGGVLRKEMQARAARLPAGHERETRAALERGDGRAAELDLAIFVAALARDLARDADKTLAAGGSAEARTAAATRFLEAIWRYYNLVDFAISARDARTSVGVRLAFDEAEGYLKTVDGRAPADPARLQAPLQRVAQLLGQFVDASAPGSSSPAPSASSPRSTASPTRRDS
jgi:hypothetical protein